MSKKLLYILLIPVLLISVTGIRYSSTACGKENKEVNLHTLSYATCCLITTDFTQIETKSTRIGAFKNLLPDAVLNAATGFPKLLAVIRLNTWVKHRCPILSTDLFIVVQNFRL